MTSDQVTEFRKQCALMLDMAEQNIGEIYELVDNDEAK